jgi:hypothetical protein
MILYTIGIPMYNFSPSPCPPPEGGGNCFYLRGAAPLLNSPLRMSGSLASYRGFNIISLFTLTFILSLKGEEIEIF